MTNTTQDTFLRELAEALGWVKHPRVNGLVPNTYKEEQAYADVWFWITEKHSDRADKWLLTNDGRDYLVALARAEGHRVDTIRIPNGGVRVVIYEKGIDVASYVHPTRTVAAINANTEPEATAYAVAKMLKVKLPEGVE